MKKRLLTALVFPIPWLLYCGFRMLSVPLLRTAAAFGGTVAGAIFLWGTGFALLHMLQNNRAGETPAAPAPGWKRPVLVGALLIALDQAAKLLILRFLPQNSSLPLLGNWLSIRFAPNHSNSVVFALLNIQIPSRLANILLKVAFLAIFAFVIIILRKSTGANTADVRYRYAFVLIAAGGICSLVDTVLLGYVLDFIVLSPLVAFDLKDLYLMYGIGLLLLAVAEWEQKSTAKQEDAAQGSSPNTAPKHPSDDNASEQPPEKEKK